MNISVINYVKRLTKSRFFRNVLVVATGTAGAQVVTMAFAPAITRLYGPEAFGLLGMFTAILAIATPLAAMTYPIAIVLPKSDSDAKGVAKLSITLSLIVAMLMAAMILLFGDAFAEAINQQAISKYLIFIPVAMFFTAFQQVMQQWLIRKQQFKIGAKVAISQSFILNSTKSVLGFFYPAGSVLIVLATLGNALLAAQLWLAAKKWSAGRDEIDFRSGARRDLVRLAYTYKDFPLYRGPQVFISALTAGTPILILAMFSNAVTVGHFALSNMVMAAPALLIGKSVGSVFYPKIAETTHAGKSCLPLLKKAMFLLSMVSFFPFFIVFIFGEEVFSFVFGAEWGVSGQFASILAVSVFLGVVHRPCESVMYVYGLTRQYFVIEVLCTLLMLSVMYFLGLAGYGSKLIVFSFVLIKSLYYLFVIGFCYWVVFNRSPKLG